MTWVLPVFKAQSKKKKKKTTSNPKTKYWRQHITVHIHARAHTYSLLDTWDGKLKV